MENNTKNKKKNSSAKSANTKKTNTSAKSTTTKKTTTKKVSGAKQNTKKQSTNSTKVNETKNIVVPKEEKKVETPKEIIKKEVKKDNVSNSSSSDFGSEEIKKLLIIIGVVCVVMLAFYFITEVLLKKKDNDTTKEPETIVEPVIQYEEIVMGSSLKQKETDYYVLAYNEDDNMLPVYEQYIDLYKKTNEPLKLYKVNLSSSFNKSYVAEESNLSGSDINQIKVKGTTLIRVSNGSVYKYFEGNDDIVARFKYMLELN